MRALRQCVVAIIVAAVSTVVSGETRTEADAFQQLTNYLTTGNPLQQQTDGLTARIFDRENCVAGFEDDRGGTFRIYWNNVDPNSIELGYKRFGSSGGSEVLTLAGAAHVVENQLKNGLLLLGLTIAGVGEGKHDSVSIPVKDIDRSRLRKALDILYARHCSGPEERAAF